MSSQEKKLLLGWKQAEARGDAFMFLAIILGVPFGIILFLSFLSGFTTSIVGLELFLGWGLTILTSLALMALFSIIAEARMLEYQAERSKKYSQNAKK